MRHTLAILVENRFGELARIVGLFSARGYNIESLTVAETLDPEISRVTLVTSADDKTVEQIVKQVDKQVRVLSVVDLSLTNHIEREMALFHVQTKSGNERTEVTKLADIFHARVIDASQDTVTVEAVAEREGLENLLRLLKPFGICEIARGGTLAIERASAKAVKV
ncbi:MAG: acetolactate synthase small subunit [Pyrinomonadaceae bacterium]